MSSIYSIWEKWQDNLVVINFSHESMFIGDVPFPSITICPMSKFSKSKFNYTDVYRAMLKLDGDESRKVTEDEYDQFYQKKKKLFKIKIFQYLLSAG